MECSPAIVSWLESVKPGYGRFASAFAASGVEDQADLASLARDDDILDECCRALLALGAKKMHTKNIRVGLMELPAPASERAHSMGWSSQAAANMNRSRSTSPSQKRVTLPPGGPSRTTTPRREPLRRLQQAVHRVQAAVAAAGSVDEECWVPLAALRATPEGPRVTVQVQEEEEEEEEDVVLVVAADTDESQHEDDAEARCQGQQRGLGDCCYEHPQCSSVRSSDNRLRARSSSGSRSRISNRSTFR
jgi:hypothetical protein